MDFPEAMRAVLDGLAVRRLCWAEPWVVVRLMVGLLQISTDGPSAWRPWLVAESDVRARDWVT